MKKTTKYLAIIVSILLVSAIGHAQTNVIVQEQAVSMSKGKQPAYIVEIPRADNDVVVKEWSKYIREDTKSKVQKEGEEITIIGTHIDQIRKEPINIYSAIFKKDSSIKLVSFFEIDNIFFTLDKKSKSIENEKIYHSIKNFVRDFAIERYREVVALELNNEQEKLKDLNHELEKHEKGNVSYRKEITENEQDILNTESAISSLETAKARKAEEIENQKIKVSSLVGDAVLQEVANKQLKGLEKEQRGINKDIEKKHKSIITFQSSIKELNRLITSNEEKQEARLKEISDQELYINKVNVKLLGIK